MTLDNLLDYGLAGIVILSFVGSSIVPLPMIPIEALVVVGYLIGINKIILFITIVLSSTFGGYTTYIIGSRGSRLADRFDKKRIGETKNYLDKWGSMYVVLSSCVFIIPYDVVALCCGILGMNKYKFFIATLLGKVVRIVAVFGILIIGFR